MQSWEHAKLRAPSVEDVSRFLKRAHGSAPGPDGIRFEHRRAAGDSGAETLLCLTRALSKGEVWPEVNDHMAVLLPKEIDDPELIEAEARVPADTRPLSLKNTDVKTAMSIVNKAVKKKLPSHGRGAEGLRCFKADRRQHRRY